MDHQMQNVANSTHGSPDTLKSPTWAYRWLVAAGVYNLAWGALAIVWPQLLFDLTGAERPNYLEIWQCVGMIVGVYGIGYLIAARDSRTHWPIVLVGLLGKIFGPIGFAVALLRGTFPALFGLTILTNDLLWWIPFAMILRDAATNARKTGTSPMRRQLFVKESTIPARPEEVFRFHESPTALEELIPPWEAMKVVQSAGSLRPGSQVVLQGSVLGIPVKWRAVHTEYDPPHLFADRQESGPFAYWYHRHRFLDDGHGGTLLRDEVEYTVPLGIIGQWCGGWLVRRKLAAMFDYRHEKTRRLIESGAWQDRR
ncbi:MAG: SRPBCC family protein [Pirellulales bacterium]